jgi:hypothetical protein
MKFINLTKGILMKSLFLLVLMNACVASAANLEDLTILDIKPGQSHLKLKLRSKDMPEDSYFFLDIVQSDPDSFGKMMLIIEKLARGDSYRLGANVKSFSDSPSGSYYKSEGVSIFEIPNREPNGLLQHRKNKKQK